MHKSLFTLFLLTCGALSADMGRTNSHTRTTTHPHSVLNQNSARHDHGAGDRTGHEHLNRASAREALNRRGNLNNTGGVVAPVVVPNTVQTTPVIVPNTIQTTTPSTSQTRSSSITQTRSTAPTSNTRTTPITPSNTILK
jgi:hypothetical protein